jgi:hypothetical protein
MHRKQFQLFKGLLLLTLSKSVGRMFGGQPAIMPFTTSLTCQAVPVKGKRFEAELQQS